MRRRALLAAIIPAALKMRPAFASAFDDCVLAHVDGMQSNLGVLAVKEACIHRVEQVMPAFDDESKFSIQLYYESTAARHGFGVYVDNNTGFVITEIKVELVNHLDRRNPKSQILTMRDFPAFPLVGENEGHHAADRTLDAMIGPGHREFYYPIEVPVANAGWPGVFTWRVAAMKGFPE